MHWPPATFDSQRDGLDSHSLFAGNHYWAWLLSLVTDQARRHLNRSVNFNVIIAKKVKCQLLLSSASEVVEIDAAYYINRSAKSL